MSSESYVPQPGDIHHFTNPERGSCSSFMLVRPRPADGSWDSSWIPWWALSPVNGKLIKVVIGHSKSVRKVYRKGVMIFDGIYGDFAPNELVKPDV